MKGSRRNKYYVLGGHGLGRLQVPMYRVHKGSVVCSGRVAIGAMIIDGAGRGSSRHGSHGGAYYIIAVLLLCRE